MVTWAHGVVVSHPLRMRKALGSNPSGSIFLPPARCLWPLASSSPVPSRARPPRWPQRTRGHPHSACPTAAMPTLSDQSPSWRSGSPSEPSVERSRLSSAWGNPPRCTTHSLIAGCKVHHEGSLKCSRENACLTAAHFFECVHYRFLALPHVLSVERPICLMRAAHTSKCTSKRNLRN